MNAAESNLESAVLALLSLEGEVLADLQRETMALASTFMRLPGLADRIRKQHEAMVHNAAFLRKVLVELELVHADAVDTAPTDADGKSLSSCTSSVIGVLQQLVREWSDDGEPERAQAFDPLVDAIRRYAPSTSNTDNGTESPVTRVLVPGAGLGRLVFELAAHGYAATGTETSFLMLVPAWYILRKLLFTGRADAHTIYPFVHHMSNVQTAADLTRAITLPGVPGARPPPPTPLSMNLVASTLEELCAVASHVAEWDAVATCFFLDACADVVSAVDSIATLLRPGGIWTSTGPLLYHGSGEDVEGGGAACGVTPGPKLCADELLQLIGCSGFELLESHEHAAAYCDDTHSMSRNEYRCQFFVARRVETVLYPGGPPDRE